ncbi:hypothetical protein EZ313_17955 [Ramlibacter henchirensis]|uniref:Uncharacterized protein n=1 Tax=Ramlibacter henchirensis TaxID=204072 RepID=A0A4Z0BUU6_9BURK|nr:hypothetical protein [Ramlibacter henchirensis]TFZ03097.1 hypothetical protein EZ313_17955 [Ramlibacter henchirensis]
MSSSHAHETGGETELASGNAGAPAAAESGRLLRPSKGQAPAKGQVSFDASAALLLRERARSWRERVPLVVDSELMFSVAGEDLQAVKALQHEVEAQRVAITRPLNEALRAVNALFRAPKQFLEEAEAMLKRAMLAYTAAERERLEAERSEAQQRQCEEQARLAGEQRELEATAREDEHAAQEAQARANDAARSGDLDMAAKERASAAEYSQRAASSWTKAQELVQQAEEGQVVTYAGALAATTRLEGISERTTYAAQVTDLRQLVCAVAAGQAPLECLQADEKFLGAQARALRRTGQLYPGVDVSAERSLAASRPATLLRAAQMTAFGGTLEGLPAQLTR